MHIWWEQHTKNGAKTFEQQDHNQPKKSKLPTYRHYFHKIYLSISFLNQLFAFVGYLNTFFFDGACVYTWKASPFKSLHSVYAQKTTNLLEDTEAIKPSKLCKSQRQNLVCSVTSKTKGPSLLYKAWLCIEASFRYQPLEDTGSKNLNNFLAKVSYKLYTMEETIVTVAT